MAERVDRYTLKVEIVSPPFVLFVFFVVERAVLLPSQRAQRAHLQPIQSGVPPRRAGRKPTPKGSPLRVHRAVATPFALLSRSLRPWRNAIELAFTLRLQLGFCTRLFVVNPSVPAVHNLAYPQCFQCFHPLSSPFPDFLISRFILRLLPIREIREIRSSDVPCPLFLPCPSACPP